MKNLRFERKIIESILDPRKIELIIKNHPALFKEIYHPRRINNIYLDTELKKDFNENEDGINKRKKIRIRWYNKTFGQIKPSLEIKTKKGLISGKEVFELPILEINKEIKWNKIKKIILDYAPERLKNEIKKRVPMLLNSYKRKYFISKDKRFRLTLDTELTVYKINKLKNNFLQKVSKKNNIIIELKYKPEHDEHASYIINHLPFRLDKNSKYVNGIKLIKN